MSGHQTPHGTPTPNPGGGWLFGLAFRVGYSGWLFGFGAATFWRRSSWAPPHPLTAAARRLSVWARRGGLPLLERRHVRPEPAGVGALLRRGPRAATARRPRARVHTRSRGLAADARTRVCACCFCGAAGGHRVRAVPHAGERERTNLLGAYWDRLTSGDAATREAAAAAFVGYEISISK
eukprot:6307019-Prymnesium_polylepis.2